MKNKWFIVILFLIIASKANAQTDTLKVYLEKNQKHIWGVDLVFANNSNDTILLFTRFHNFSLGVEIPHYSGISIEYFSNDKPFTFNWGELPPLMFTFNKGFTLINPRSKVKLFFNVGYYRFPDKSDEKYEVSFFMNYLYSKYPNTEVPKKIEYFRTNRVTIVEQTEEEIRKNTNSVDDEK
jgi:hypothetical protein